jgi:hypothetical protein
MPSASQREVEHALWSRSLHLKSDLMKEYPKEVSTVCSDTASNPGFDHGDLQTVEQQKNSGKSPPLKQQDLVRSSQQVFHET